VCSSCMHDSTLSVRPAIAGGGRFGDRRSQQRRLLKLFSLSLSLSLFTLALLFDLAALIITA
jgi:hypothetical protein